MKTMIKRKSVSAGKENSETSKHSHSFSLSHDSKRTEVLYFKHSRQRH